MNDELSPEAQPAAAQSKKEMSRGQQTAWIVAAIIGAAGAYFVYDATVTPNLDGVHPYERCSYWAYYKNHGGDPESCRSIEAAAAADRLRGGVAY